jgi:hypothetical protein
MFAARHITVLLDAAEMFSHRAVNPGTARIAFVQRSANFPGLCGKRCSPRSAADSCPSSRSRGCLLYAGMRYLPSGDKTLRRLEPRWRFLPGIPPFREAVAEVKECVHTLHHTGG